MGRIAGAGGSFFAGATRLMRVAGARGLAAWGVSVWQAVRRAARAGGCEGWGRERVWHV